MALDQNMHVMQSVLALTARQYAADQNDTLIKKMDRHAAQLRSAIMHSPREVVPLEEQVSTW